MPDLRQRLRTAAALAAAALLALSGALTPVAAQQLTAEAASAAGQSGTRPAGMAAPASTAQAEPIPLTNTVVKAPQQHAEAVFDIAALLTEEDASAYDLSTLRFGDGTTRYEAAGEGVWTIRGTDVTFAPGELSTGAPQTVAIQLTRKDGGDSAPTELTVVYPYLPPKQVSESEGEPVKVRLRADPELVDMSTVRFNLKQAPGGTVLSADGRRLIVPDEGTWEIDRSGQFVTFTPARQRLGAPPTTVTIMAEDMHGAALPPGQVQIVTPVLPSLVESAVYGEPVVFDLRAHAQSIDMSTLELVEPVTGGEVSMNEARDRATVEEQGSWELDRTEGTLTFTPMSPSITAVSPMGIRGKDPAGHTSSVAPMMVGYPLVSPTTATQRTGDSAVLSPLAGSVHVQPLSLRLTTDGLPAGTVVSDDGGTLTVPGQGQWVVDRTHSTVTFAPDQSLRGSPDPVVFTVDGRYANNTVSSTIELRYADRVPILRDDDINVNSSGPVTVDVLANDTPASAANPLNPGSIQLRSNLATNLKDLDEGRGTKLVIPDEGTWTVSPAGVVTFTPVEGFSGRASPVRYSVEDSTGVRSSAVAVVTVDEELAAAASTGSDETGVNALLVGIRPGSSSMFAVYMSLTGVLVFTGVVTLWVGAQMETGRPLLRRR